MQQRYVGNSGLRVSALSLGTMSWAGETDEQDASELLRTFVDAGGTLIDTAASYADGQAEAHARRHARATSSPAPKSSSPPKPEFRRRTAGGAWTRRGTRCSPALDASLARLGTDYVDIWFAQAWDPNVPLDETLSALEFAVRSGRARYAGVSNFNGWQTAKAAAVAGFPLVANQSEYSLVQRNAGSGTDSRGRGCRARPDGLGAAGARRADRKVPRAAFPARFAGGQIPAGRLRGAVP